MLRDGAEPHITQADGKLNRSFSTKWRILEPGTCLVIKSLVLSSPGTLTSFTLPLDVWSWTHKNLTDICLALPRPLLEAIAMPAVASMPTRTTVKIRPKSEAKDWIPRDDDIVLQRL